ncbi:FHA domain-containing protein [Kitasatospora sp. NPDC004240]
MTEGLAVCPICRTPQTGRFCEECGYDYDLATPSRRQPPAYEQPQPPAPGPAPLNIPPSYGGPAAPQPPAAPAQPAPPRGGYGYPQPGAAGGYPPPAPAPEAYEQPQPPAYEQPSYEQPAYEQPPAQPQPPAYEQPQPPYEAYQGGGYPGTAGGAPAAAGAAREESGPVYAQPGRTGRGEEFGTSFNLAPPVQQPPAAPAEQARTTWIAVVSADRDYFTDMMARSGPEAAGLFFPPYCPERRIPLTGRGQLRIGRRSQHRGTVPEIDLSVPPEDPGASHQHAMLAEQADGSWVLVDQDSTNGTTMNGGAEPVAPHTAIPLGDGDRIHVGAWTTITMHRA